MILVQSGQPTGFDRGCYRIWAGSGRASPDCPLEPVRIPPGTCLPGPSPVRATLGYSRYLTGQIDRAFERGVRVECRGQIIYHGGRRLENHSAECRLGIITLSVNLNLMSPDSELVTRHFTCLPGPSPVRATYGIWLGKLIGPLKGGSGSSVEVK